MCPDDPKSIDYGQEGDTVWVKKETELDPKVKLKFAGYCLVCIFAFNVLVAVFYCFVNFWSVVDKESAKNVWLFFSQLSANLIMLIFGYYFAKN